MTDPLVRLYESISNSDISELIVTFHYRGATGYLKMEQEIDNIASSLGLESDGAESFMAISPRVRTIFFTGDSDTIEKLYDILDEKYPNKLGLEIRDSE